MVIPRPPFLSTHHSDKSQTGRERVVSFLLLKLSDSLGPFHVPPPVLISYEDRHLVMWWVHCTLVLVSHEDRHLIMWWVHCTLRPNPPLRPTGPSLPSLQFY